MDPISMTLAVASAGMKMAGGAMSIFGAGQQYRQAKRVTRMKQATLRQNADMAMAQSTFEQNRVDDQIDAVQGAQVNYFAGGNLDMTSGSPAVLQAMTEAQGETDKMLLAARGVQKRADAFQQISDLESGLNDQRVAMSYGVGTTMLNTASELLAMFGPKGSFGGK
ncbi:MAG: hypothetical protein ACRDBL_03785, partial [Rhabdaerophilum sp.]